MDVVLTAVGYSYEAEEGAEYDLSREEFKGEAAVADYEDDYQRIPVITLAQKSVIEVTSVMEKRSHKKIEVVDLTDNLELSYYQSYPIPSYDQCYINRKMGDEFIDAKLFFNPSWAGCEFDVEYSYYCDTVYTGAYASGGKTYFIEAGRNIPTAIDGSKDYSPRFGESYPLVISGNYAVMPSGLLCKRASTWMGYITTPVIGQDVPRWGIITGLAASANMVVYERDGLKVVPRRGKGVYHLRDIKTITLEERLIYKTVVVEYINGKAVAGEGDPILTIPLPYIYDKGIADIIVQRALDWYTNGEAYTLELYGVYDDISLLHNVSFNYQGKTKTGFITTIIFNNSRTRVEVISGV